MLVDQLPLQAHGLEDLGRAVGLDRRDAHLGDRLQQPFADRFDVVLGGLLGVDDLRPAVRPGPHEPLLEHQLVERLERQVGVDGARPVADQGGEVVHLARLAGLEDDPGPQAGALQRQVVVDRGHRQQRRDGGAFGAQPAVGQDDDVHALGDRLAGFAADALDRLLHARLPLRHRPGDVEGPRFVDVVFDVPQRLELAVQQDRLFEQQLVGVLGGLFEQVALVAEAGREAHHDLLADRVDRRVGDLREQLLEVREQRRGLVGEDRQREVVAHRPDRLGAFDRHRREQHPQVLLAVAEGPLAQVQGLFGDRHLFGGGQVPERHRVAGVPLAVGVLGGDLALELLVLDDPAPLEVHQEQLPRLQPAEALDVLRGDVQQPRLGAEHDVAVERLHPAAGPQPVAVERGADHAPVGEGDRRRAVPRLHEAGVVGVEGLQVVRQVVPVAVGLGDHHHRRVGQRAARQHQQLEHVVEGGRVGVAGRDDRQDALQVVPEQLRVQLALAGPHPVDVAHQGVDLAVVADHPVGVGQLPAGEGVGREARVHQRHRALGALVAQVGVEGRQLVADQHALVVDRPRGARDHVQARLLGGQVGDPPDHVQLALEGVLVVLARPGGAHEQLADDRPAGAGHAPGLLRRDGDVTPAEQALAHLGDGVLEQLFQAPPGSVLGRQEAHQHAVGARRRELERGHRPEQLVGHLHQDPGPVARARVRARGTAMLQVLQRRDRPRHDLVGGLVVQPRDHPHPAGVVLETGVVESGFPGRVHV